MFLRIGELCVASFDYFDTFALISPDVISPDVNRKCFKIYDKTNGKKFTCILLEPVWRGPTLWESETVNWSLVLCSDGQRAVVRSEILRCA